MKKLSPPPFGKLNDYYQTYWKYLEGDDLLTIMTKQTYIMNNWLASVPDKIQNHRYAEGKWMLKEVIGHLCDTERILTYRALRFSRNDSTPLPAFDENAFMMGSNYRSRELKDIIEEWQSIRTATISFFSSLDEEMADRTGVANGVEVSARILLYFILMHEKHHLQVMKDRYLTSAVSV